MCGHYRDRKQQDTGKLPNEEIILPINEDRLGGAWGMRNIVCAICEFY